MGKDVTAELGSSAPHQTKAPVSNERQSEKQDDKAAGAASVADKLQDEKGSEDNSENAKYLSHAAAFSERAASSPHSRLQYSGSAWHG
jgi:hypothetical protein